MPNSRSSDRSGGSGRDQRRSAPGRAGRGQGGRPAQGRPWEDRRGGYRGRDRRERAPEVEAPYDEDGIRLQKVLADAGVASRRAAENLILAGRVSVDGVRVRELGVRVDPQTRRIEVDGLPLESDPTRLVLALHKPAGVLSSMAQPEDRPTLAEYVRHRSERLFHVGRLDLDTEGLILLTNDGDLANALARPANQVPKTYLSTVEGRVRPGVGKQLRQGIELDDGVAAVDSFRIVDAIPGYTQVEIVLHSGRNRVVRRLLEELGHPVVRLVRVKIGPVPLGDLKPGRSRVLSPLEVASLKRAAGL